MVGVGVLGEWPVQFNWGILKYLQHLPACWTSNSIIHFMNISDKKSQDCIIILQNFAQSQFQPISLVPREVEILVIMHVHVQLARACVCVCVYERGRDGGGRVQVGHQGQRDIGMPRGILAPIGHGLYQPGV